MKIIIHAGNIKRGLCQVCGKEFVGRRKQKTCSKKCYDELNAKKKSQKKADM